MKYIYFVIMLAFFGAASCISPSQIESSWENPEIKKDSTKLFQKILFIALLKNDAARRIAEDKLVAQVKPRGIASYNYLNPAESRSDESILSTRLKQDGFDGIVILRLAADDKQSPYVPGAYPSYYNSWYGYYSSTYPRFSTNGNYSPNSLYHIETNIYSLTSSKLIWTGITTIVQTNDTGRMVDQIIATVKEKMRRQGLIK